NRGDSVFRPGGAAGGSAGDTEVAAPRAAGPRRGSDANSRRGPRLAPRVWRRPARVKLEHRGSGQRHILEDERYLDQDGAAAGEDEASRRALVLARLVVQCVNLSHTRVVGALILAGGQGEW